MYCILTATLSASSIFHSSFRLSWTLFAKQIVRNAVSPFTTVRIVRIWNPKGFIFQHRKIFISYTTFTIRGYFASLSRKDGVIFFKFIADFWTFVASLRQRVGHYYNSEKFDPNHIPNHRWTYQLKTQKKTGEASAQIRVSQRFQKNGEFSVDILCWGGFLRDFVNIYLLRTKGIKRPP